MASHFHVWILDDKLVSLVDQAEFGSQDNDPVATLIRQDESVALVSELELTVLVRLPAVYDYRNAAVRSAPPGQRSRVFQCQDNCS